MSSPDERSDGRLPSGVSGASAATGGATAPLPSVADEEDLTETTHVSELPNELAQLDARKPRPTSPEISGVDSTLPGNTTKTASMAPVKPAQPPAKVQPTPPQPTPVVPVLDGLAAGLTGTLHSNGNGPSPVAAVQAKLQADATTTKATGSAAKASVPPPRTATTTSRSSVVPTAPRAPATAPSPRIGGSVAPTAPMGTITQATAASVAAAASTTDRAKSSVPPPIALGAPDVRITTAKPPERVPSRPPPAVTPTLIGAGPASIVPRRRTPAAGTVAPVLPGSSVAPPAPPAGSLPPPPAPAQPSMPPGGHTSSGDIVPPMIRIPHGGGARATPTDPMRAGSMLCEVLLRNGSVTPENVDRALTIQEERGGQIGRILVQIGACTEDAIARGLVEQLRLRKTHGGDDISLAAREHKDVAGLRVLTRPGMTVVVLMLTDFLSLVLAALLATSVHWARTYSELGELDWTSWLVVAPAIGLCMLSYLGVELYSPMAKSTPDEIRDVTFATSAVHLGAFILASLGDLPIVRWGVFVRAVWWLATLIMVPIIRATVRNWLCVQPWWGIPVCVLGAAKTGRLIARTLKAQPRSGLKPVMLLDDDPQKLGTLRASLSNDVMDVHSVNMSAAHFMSESTRKQLADDLFGDDDELSGPISADHIPVAAPSSWSGRVDSNRPPATEFLGPESSVHTPRIPKEATVYPRGKFAEVEGIPLVGDLSLAPVLAHRLKIPYAVVAMPGVDSPKLLQIIERVGGKFSHLLVIPDLFGFASMGVPAKNLGGILGVEVRQQLLLPGPRLAKRVMDVALTGFGALFVLPFLLLIALLIKVDSRGPVFYTQKRLGKDGSYFKAYKFRTMHGDGEERLKAILDADPELRAEYEIYHKLRKDPRVTRVGRVLRKFSLDEFPQLWNVINGDMSLVGPRPYIERELTEMNGQEKIILRAPPGMTGMWQVSDRNATSFAQRCQIDVYYVRNWSPWLDIHILAKTFGVVVKGSGV